MSTLHATLTECWFAREWSHAAHCSAGAERECSARLQWSGTAPVEPWAPAERHLVLLGRVAVACAVPRAQERQCSAT